MEVFILKIQAMLNEKVFIDVNNYIPFSKNPKIAKVFREIGLADELGSGVRRITEYTRIYSGKEPIMEEGDVFKVTIPLNKNAFDRAQDRAQDILIFCKFPKSLKEIIEYFGYKNARKFREKYIQPLVDDNRLKMTIPDKPTSKNQKYISK